MLSITSTSSRTTIFTAFEPERAAAHVVHDPARRADDDLRALPQPVELAVVGLAAVDRQRVDAALEERQLVDLLRDLHGQFARRAKDQHLHRRARPRSTFSMAGTAKAAVLPGAGLRLAHDVLALHQHRDGRGLDRRRLLEAEFVDGLQQFARKAEFRE